MSDVFISHSSKDSEIAEMVCRFLEERGLSCWMAPRDILPGSDWAASINTAITASRVFLVIYSANSAASHQVAREVALAETRQNVFILPYKIDDTSLSGSFEYYLTGAHWIAANIAQKDYRFEEMYAIIAGMTGKSVQNITNNTYIDHLHIHGTDTSPEAVQAGLQAAQQVLENQPADAVRIPSADKASADIAASENRQIPPAPAQSLPVPPQTVPPMPEQPRSNKKMIILISVIAGSVLLIAIIVLIIVLVVVNNTTQTVNNALNGGNGLMEESDDWGMDDYPYYLY